MALSQRAEDLNKAKLESLAEDPKNLVCHWVHDTFEDNMNSTSVQTYINLVAKKLTEEKERTGGEVNTDKFRAKITSDRDPDGKVIREFKDRFPVIFRYASDPKVTTKEMDHILQLVRIKRLMETGEIEDEGQATALVHDYMRKKMAISEEEYKRQLQEQRKVEEEEQMRQMLAMEQIRRAREAQQMASTQGIPATSVMPPAEEKGRVEEL